MRIPQILLSIPALVALSATASASDRRGYRDTLLVLDHQFWEASERGDVRTIGRLVADDYVGIDQEQNRWTRPALLDQFRAVRTSDLRRKADPEVLRLSDDSAVLTYEAAYKAHYGGVVIDSGPLRMSSCWAKRDGGWFLVFSQVSAVATPAPAPDPTASEAASAPPSEAVADPSGRHNRSLLHPSGEGETLVAAPRDAAKSPFAVGQRIVFQFAVRNTTRRDLRGHFSTEAAFYCTPKVEDARGTPVKVSAPTVELSGVWALVPYRVAPGEEKVVGTACLAFEPDGPALDTAEGFRTHGVAHAGAGRYRVTYPGAAAVEVEIR